MTSSKKLFKFGDQKLAVKCLCFFGDSMIEYDIAIDKICERTGSSAVL